MSDTDARPLVHHGAGGRLAEPVPASGQSLHPAAMRRQNISSLLRAILDLGPVARVELVQQTGISSATVTKLVASMLDAGVLVPRTDRTSVGLTGRPRVPVDLNLTSRVVLGLHIGATRNTVAALDLRAGHVVERAVKHKVTTPEAVIDSAIHELHRLRDELPERRVLGVGVSSGGRVDHRSGKMLAHPVLGWRDIPVRSIVAREVDIPVEYDDTVRGTAMAELMYGSLRDVEDVLHLFVGNVIGCALVVRGALHRGAAGEAGTVAHLPVVGVRGPSCECGQTNCLPQVASNAGLLAIARQRGLAGPDATYEDLVAQANGGDPATRSLLGARARWIGQGIAMLADFLDPARVLLSGNAEEWPGYLDVVRSTVATRSAQGAAIAERVRRSSFPGVLPVSSAALFLDQYFRDPVRYEPALQGRLTA